MTPTANKKFCAPDNIRHQFSKKMSNMYRKEVPAYGDLCELVSKVNHFGNSHENQAPSSIKKPLNSNRISSERHGAIRVGTAEELNVLARIFRVMGMFPVGYYDLTVAGLPVHSTAFRPISADSLEVNPFRIFTSLLRLEAVENADLRQVVEQSLSARKIVSDSALSLLELAEAQGGLDDGDAEAFITAVLDTFRWHSEALVTLNTYNDLMRLHPLVADIVSFQGPHINHLTPRVLDIDQAQIMMQEMGMPAKAVIEGPPRRQCPILLRQTAFKALNEAVDFLVGADGVGAGEHTARFGEVEERGAALTAKGRELYNSLLAKVRGKVLPAGDGSNADFYVDSLEVAFEAFPDDWDEMHNAGLIFVEYKLTELGVKHSNSGGFAGTFNALIDEGLIEFSPITYEDFLPVSAAGIFQSNLKSNAENTFRESSSQHVLEEALGQKIINPNDLYLNIQELSKAVCMAALKQ